MHVNCRGFSPSRQKTHASQRTPWSPRKEILDVYLSHYTCILIIRGAEPSLQNFRGAAAPASYAGDETSQPGQLHSPAHFKQPLKIHKCLRKFILQNNLSRLPAVTFAIQHCLFHLPTSLSSKNRWPRNLLLFMLSQHRCLGYIFSETKKFSTKSC